MSDATVLLDALERGEPAAAEQLLDLVYEELRGLAASRMAGQPEGQTLQPTALVHEAWLKLVGGRNPKFRDRTHFFRTAAAAMRQILIDRARRKRAERHGGGRQRVTWEGLDLAANPAEDQLLALDEALEQFARRYPVQADLVNLRYFAGMTNEEVAGALGVSPSTAKTYWAFARAWLLREIEARRGG